MNLEEAKQIFEDTGDTPDTYRAFYKNHYGTDTSLSDDLIIMMVMDSEDDMDPDEWAFTMKGLEK
jgi:hypothetical protein